MIQADGYEKSTHSNNQSDASKSEIVEELIRCETIGRLYISNTTHIEKYFDDTYDIKYLPMNSVDKDKKKYVYKRKPKHRKSIRKFEIFARRMREKDS